MLCGVKAVAGMQHVVMSDNRDFSNLRQHVQAVKERPVNIQLEQHSQHFYMMLYHLIVFESTAWHAIAVVLYA